MTSWNCFYGTKIHVCRHSGSVLRNARYCAKSEKSEGAARVAVLPSYQFRVCAFSRWFNRRQLRVSEKRDRIWSFDCCVFFMHIDSCSEKKKVSVSAIVENNYPFKHLPTLSIRSAT
jgi:hypothetical protein